MRLSIKAKIAREIVHFADDKAVISSQYRTVYHQRNGQIKKIKLPESILKKPLGIFRLTRRAFRLDKLNVFLYQNDLIIIRQGKVYLYNDKEDRLIHTLTLKNCRNVLHQSISVNEDGFIYFGEYGANKNRTAVPVYCSRDGGYSWLNIYNFPPKSIKHIHGCYFDKYTDKIWVCTGDFDNENCLMIANKDFTSVKKIGDGQQKFRTCNLFFTKEKVHWLMDSQLETSHHIILDRTTDETTVGQKIMGPVWYIKELSDGYYLASTAQEIGVGVLDNKVHLYCSKDLENWKSIATFDHDGYPKRYFKFGVIGFADGLQSSSSFYMFFEAIKNYDGLSLECCLEA